MSDTKQRTVLITGCSSGGLGAALALAFHDQGLRVFATARNLDKTSELEGIQGIDCLELDVLSDSSIKSCVEQVSTLTSSGSLDILVNNAGGGYYMPFMHVDITEARKLFDINVWSYVTVTQAFLPLLLRDSSPTATPKKLIVNNTSISSVLKTPYHSVYGASKAAAAAFNDAQRIELRPFGIHVIDLKTGSTESNFSDNRTNSLELPPDSPYKPIEDEVKNVITGAATEAYAEDRLEWAKNAVSDILKGNPPSQVWRGGRAGLIKVINATPIPDGLSDPGFRDLGGLDKLEKKIVEAEEERKKQTSK